MVNLKANTCNWKWVDLFIYIYPSLFVKPSSQCGYTVQNDVPKCQRMLRCFCCHWNLARRLLFICCYLKLSWRPFPHRLLFIQVLFPAMNSYLDPLPSTRYRAQLRSWIPASGIWADRVLLKMSRRGSRATSRWSGISENSSSYFFTFHQFICKLCFCGLSLEQGPPKRTLSSSNLKSSLESLCLTWRAISFAALS